MRIVKYILRRIGFMAVTLLGVSIIAFALVRIAPGNPVELLLPEDATEEQINAMEERMGLNDPVLVQYFKYIGQVLKGDLGYSYRLNKSVSQLIAERLLQTAKLAVITLVWSTIFAIVLGILAGINRGKGIDVFSMMFSLVGQSVAPVWLALMMILLFSVKLGWLPTNGSSGWQCMIMPSLCNGLAQAVLVARLTRTGMADVLSEDYITATRARGISKMKVYSKYALKNALLPVVTIIGARIGHLLAGSAVIESIFVWPGMGQLLTQAIGQRDLQLVQSLLLVSAFMISLANLLVDILYTFVDPRIQLT